MIDFSAHTYIRSILIDGIEFGGTDDPIIDGCSFSISDCGGSHVCNLKITNAYFDETYGIRQGSTIDIRYGASTGTRMFRGIVVEINTTFSEGLQLMCVGSKIILNECVPSGLFGTLADTGPPTLLDAVISAAADGVDGIQTDLDILIFARSIDEVGTTNRDDTEANPLSDWYLPLFPHLLSIPAGTITANKQLDVSWSCGNNATGTELFVIFDFFGPEQREEYYDAVGDSISIDGVFSPIEGTFWQAVNTARTATISGVTIEDIVNYLLDNFLPSGMTKGAVDIGTLNIDIDLFDLRNAGADLNQVLSTLRDIAGDAQWYIDPQNAVHFVELGTASVATFQIPASAGTTLINSSESDLLVSLSKKQMRDGITIVKIEGEPVYEDELLEQNDSDWDSETTTSLPDSDHIALTADARVHSIGIPRANVPTIPEGATKANFIDANYPTIQDWVDDFPNQRFLYLKKESLPDAFITQSLQRLRTKVTEPVDPFQSGVSGNPVGNRPQILPVAAPGISTVLTGGILGMNYLLKRNPNPVQWTCRLENVKRLYVPGQDKITVVNILGYEYVLPIMGVDYNFDENVSATLKLGDTWHSPTDAVTLHERTVQKLSLGKQSPTRWAT